MQLDSARRPGVTLDVSFQKLKKKKKLPEHAVLWLAGWFIAATCWHTHQHQTFPPITFQTTHHPTSPLSNSITSTSTNLPTPISKSLDITPVPVVQGLSPYQLSSFHIVTHLPYNRVDIYWSVRMKRARRPMGPTTRATTTRVAKARAQERLKRLVSDEIEVTFPRHMLPFDQISSGDSEDNPPHLTPHVPSGERRMEILESQVKHVQGEVSSIHSKLDRLVEATCQRPEPVYHSTPPRRHSTTKTTAPSRAAYHDDTLGDMPPPKQLRRQQNHDGYVDAATRQDWFDPPQGHGKEDFDPPESMKPYMYITQESCQTNKQKLDVRCELTALEYTNALVKLIMDHRASHPGDQMHMLRHLRDVTHDAMERPWPAVRRWSQAVFDAIERGEFIWADHQEIHNMRV